MIPYSTLLTIEPRSSQAIYVQVSNGMIALIQKGVIKPGTKLPSIRKMAAILQVHPKTIVAAYEEMMAQDWVYSKPRSGMVVSDNLPALKPRSFRSAGYREAVAVSQTNKQQQAYKYVINDGFPDYRLAPVEPLLRQYKKAFYQGDTEKLSLFTNPAGSSNLSQALAKYLSESRALRMTQENILVTRGAQMAIYIAAAILISPGDYVYVAEPGYGTASTTFEKLGARLVRIPVDENGIQVDAIEKNLAKKKPRLLYIIPHHHHPTTATLSAARRMKLISLIRELRFFVIEDDYDYEFHYNHSPILPLASSDHNGYVLYVGSITKNLSYSLRIGYLVAQEKIIAQATAYKQLMDMRGDLLLEEALAALYENGTMQRHIRKSVKLYHERRDLFCQLLKEELGDAISFKKPAGGMAVWVQFHPKYRLPEIAALAAEKGLWMKDGSFYNTADKDYNSLRMGFASMNEKEMRKITGILAEVLKNYPGSRKRVKPV